MDIKQYYNRSSCILSKILLSVLSNHVIDNTSLLRSIHTSTLRIKSLPGYSFNPASNTL